MLTKLLKYEFRSIGRQLIPLYLGVLGLAVVNHFFWFTRSDYDIYLPDGLGSIPAVATMMAYVAVMVALGVITLLLIIQRFYKGLLTEEGYLMFTLPCKPWQLIAAKGITASAMTIVGSAVGMLSIMLMGMELSDWGGIFQMFGKIPWGELFRQHALWPLYIPEGPALLLVGVFASIGHIYVSIAIGHLFHKHRVAWSIGAYIGINILQSVLMSVFFKIMNRFDWHWMNRLFENIAPAWRAHIIMLVLIACAAIPAAIFFFGTDWILKNKLNLE